MRLIVLCCLAAWSLGLGGCADPGAGAGGAQETIRRGNIEDPKTLDPLLAEDVHTFNILIDLYEGLVAENARGDIVPGVAETWSVSDDGRTYRFDLRATARWSNGEAVTADDFVDGFRRAAEPGSLSVYAALLEPIENFPAVKNGTKRGEQLAVEAIDERTLVIRLSEPLPYFLSLLAMPIAYPLHGDAPDLAQFEDPSSFVGNGAYLLAERRLGAPVKLQKNEQYWNADAVTMEFVEYFPIVDELTEYNMYRSGELDITATVPVSQVQSAREEFAAEVRISPSLALYYLAFDLTEPPLDNKDLRQALAMAIDREQLVSVLGRGEQPAYAIVPPGVANYRGPVYRWKRDVDQSRNDQARALYERAGYGPGNPLTLEFIYDAGGIHQQVALAVGSMWEEVLGVSVEYDKREWKYFLDTRQNRGEWQVMRFSWFGDYNDASTFLDIFDSDSVQNLPRYKNDDYDRLVRQASSETDAAVRTGKLAAAEKILIDDYPIAPLYFFVSKHLVKPDVQGFESNVLDRHPSRFLYRGDDGR